MKKCVLFLGRPEADLDKIRENLCLKLGVKAPPVFVFAKDGPEAASKAANQKFDAVVIDPNSHRINEGGFLMGLRSQSNTAQANLIVIAPSKEWTAPATLKKVDQVLCAPCTVEVLVEALTKALKQFQETKGTAFAIDAKVLNALLKATRMVCGQFGIESLQLHKPQIKELGTTWKGDVAASIAIRSRAFQGALVISFDQNVYLKIVSTMLGEEYKVLSDEIADAIGEISNMILGNAKSDFTEYDISLTLPVLLKKGAVLEHPPGSADFLISAETPMGLVYIEVVAHPLAAAA